jgi:hypothetical protein
MPKMTMKSEPSQAINDILIERIRQLSEEGFDAAHDDSHKAGELSCAAVAYAMWAANALEPEPNVDMGNPPAWWPWDLSWWKPKDPRRDLVRAAALILAELERLDRASARTSAGDE